MIVQDVCRIEVSKMQVCRIGVIACVESKCARCEWVQYKCLERVRETAVCRIESNRARCERVEWKRVSAGARCGPALH